MTASIENLTLRSLATLHGSLERIASLTTQESTHCGNVNSVSENFLDDCYNHVSKQIAIIEREIKDRVITSYDDARCVFEIYSKHLEDDEHYREVLKLFNYLKAEEAV